MRQEILVGTRNLTYAELFTSSPSKRCGRCRQVKPLSEFHREKKGYQSWCKVCRKVVRPLYRVDNRKQNLRKNYGITPEQYDALLLAQNGHCACCPATTGDSTGKPLHVDHEHSTGRIRGLLCSHCNRALGNVRDDPARLRRLADYLEIVR